MIFDINRIQTLIKDLDKWETPHIQDSRGSVISLQSFLKIRKRSTYDGASVISGHVAGVQKLFCHLCGREVPYIHCYCHRLKLVIDELLKTVPGVSDHFFPLSVRLL